MKIKRFFAADVRGAMRTVREALGEDAVILSNRRVNGGIEIIAAVDYDERALRDEIQRDAGSERRTPRPLQDTSRDEPGMPPRAAWSQEPALMEMRGEIKTLRGMLESQLMGRGMMGQAAATPHHEELGQRLAALGLGAGLTRALLDALPVEGNEEEQWRRLLGKIAVRLSITDDDILTHGGAVALVGPTGVGKTTTVAKLAARFVMRHGARSVALISTDSYRIGAHEQLKAYARILDVPIRFANDAAALQTALDHFCDKRLVLIDTAGMSQRDLRLSEQFAVLKGESDRVRSYLVASTTTRLSGLEEVVRGFQGIDLSGCILTKLDESTSLGHALDVVIRHRLPVAYVSDGQRVPEDLQPARAHTLVSRAVAVMQESTELLGDEIPGLRTVEAGY